jgi:site-specific DNA recombinase
MTKPIVRKLRCAIYSRKSSEEGLEQEFNSLHAQREACEAFIASQRSEGWVLVRDQYDDGGISGGTLERPGLQRLLEDIEDGLVDVVVVYKIDRLSRSLADFAKLVEVFDRNGVTFVSVTQSFNTTTSMGRLTLNILLSFAQFEREVTAERIRDKVAASRKKGMWMGGVPPYGYRVENRKLVVDGEAAEHVRWIFARFLEIGSGTELAREVAKRGIRTPRGNRIDKKYLYRMLNNRAYIGEAVHKGECYPGEHDAIIDRATWDRVHAILQESPRKRAARTRADTPALLKGLLFGPDDAAFSPTHTADASGRAVLRKKLTRDQVLGFFGRHVHAAARPGTWLGEMLTRKPQMLVRVALANKMARIVWALMARGGVFQSPAAAAQYQRSRSVIVGTRSISLQD